MKGKVELLLLPAAIAGWPLDTVATLGPRVFGLSLIGGCYRRASGLPCLLKTSRSGVTL